MKTALTLHKAWMSVMKICHTLGVWLFDTVKRHTLDQNRCHGSKEHVVWDSDGNDLIIWVEEYCIICIYLQHDFLISTLVMDGEKGKGEDGVANRILNHASSL